MDCSTRAALACGLAAALAACSSSGGSSAGGGSAGDEAEALAGLTAWNDAKLGRWSDCGLIVPSGRARADDEAAAWARASAAAVAAGRMTFSRDQAEACTAAAAAETCAEVIHEASGAAAARRLAGRSSPVPS